MIPKTVAPNPWPMRPGRFAAAMAGIVCLVMIASSAVLFLILGPHEFEKILLVQMGLACGVVFLIFLYHWPPVGVALLLAGGLIVSFRLGTGTETGLNGAVLMVPPLLVILAIQRFFSREDFVPVLSRSVAPALSFMGVAVLAFLVGQYPWFPAAQAPLTVQIGQLGIFLLLVGIFLACAHFLRSLLWLELICWFFMLMGALHLMIRLVPGMSFQVQGVLPVIIHSGSMFWTWLVAISFGQFLLNDRLHPFLRLAAGGIAGTALGIVLVQTRDWLSGWVPAMVAIGVILVLRFPRLILIIAPLSVALGIVLGMDQIAELATGGDNLYSLETRGAAFQSLLPVLSANPVLGLGPANYYGYTALFPILGWYVSYSSHNNYLDLVAQTGLVGLGCFFWFAWALARTVLELRDRVRGGFEEGFVYAVLGGLAATLFAGALGDWIIPFVYNAGFEGFRTSILPWVFWGGLVALEQIVPKRSFAHEVQG